MVGDAELALAAADGDRNALADIYDRYADALYELCRAVLHDAHEASDAVQDTFVIASTRLGQLRDPDRLKPWLFAIARRESIRRSSKRARMRPARDEVLDVPVMDDTAGAAVAGDAAKLVWDAANALTERERAVLVLNVRQGLEGADLADAAGMPGPQASVVLSRAKTQLASAVRCTLLVRNGRGDCAELAAIVPHAHRMIDGLTRKRVARHAQSCAACEPKWSASPDALGILAAAPVLGAPAALKNKVLDDLRLISSSRPLGGGAWRSDGFPADERRNRRPLLVSIAAALIALVVAATLVLAGDDDSPTLSATDLPDAPTTTSTTLVTGGTVTTAAVASGPTTSVRRTPTTRRGATTTRPRPAPGLVPAPTAAPPTTPPPTAAPAMRITSRGPSSMTTCAPATFSATVEGGSPNFLWLIYTRGSSYNAAGMSRNGDVYSTQLSIPDAGEYTWRVATSPSGGGTSSASKPLSVTPCPQ